MKTFTLLLFTVGIVSINLSAEPDFVFLPAADGASVSFEGITQEGAETHRFEVRRLGFRSDDSEPLTPTLAYYAIYYAGKEYGPTVLKRIEGHSPLVHLIGDEKIFVYFIAGANTHVKQIWKIEAGSAAIVDEIMIDAADRPEHSAAE